MAAKYKPYLSNGLTAKQCYDKLNRYYFRDKLPDIPVKWTAKHVAQMGYTAISDDPYYPQFISLNPRYRYSDKLWLFTLLHEMVHVEQVLQGIPLRQLHGPKFRRRMRSLAAKGAFDYLW